MSKVTLNRVASLVNATTTINGILTQIEQAFDNCLSRDGSAPNQMTSTLDMNSNRIINLPFPLTSTEPARKYDLEQLVLGNLESVIATTAQAEEGTETNALMSPSTTLSAIRYRRRDLSEFLINDYTGTFEQKTNAAIAAAAAAGGGRVIIPAGNYTSAAAIIVSNANVEIELLPGAVITKASGVADHHIFELAAANTAVFGRGTLNGNKANVVGAASMIWVRTTGFYIGGLTVNDGASHGILLAAVPNTSNTYAGRGVVERCIVNGVDGIGIGHNGDLDYQAYETTIRDNWIYNCGNEGITVDVGCQKVNVVNNVITSCGRTGGVGGIGLDKVYAAYVVGNHIEAPRVVASNTRLPGICVQNNVASSSHIIIEGNTLKTTSIGVYLKATGANVDPVLGNLPGGVAVACVVGTNVYVDCNVASVKVDSGCAANIVKLSQFGDANVAQPVIIDEPSTIGPIGAYYLESRLTADVNNVTGDGTPVKIIWDQKVKERGYFNAYNTSTGVFTAPISGVYDFSGQVRAIGGTPTYGLVSLDTSTSSFLITTQTIVVAGVVVIPFATKKYLAKGETVTINIAAYGSGSGTVSIDGSSGTNPIESFYTIYYLG